MSLAANQPQSMAEQDCPGRIAGFHSPAEKQGDDIKVIGAMCEAAV
jgi:hypothetical protein